MKSGRFQRHRPIGVAKRSRRRAATTGLGTVTPPQLVYLGACKLVQRAPSISSDTNVACACASALFSRKFKLGYFGGKRLFCQEIETARRRHRFRHGSAPSMGIRRRLRTWTTRTIDLERYHPCSRTGNWPVLGALPGDTATRLGGAWLSSPVPS